MRIVYQQNQYECASETKVNSSGTTCAVPSSSDACVRITIPTTAQRFPTGKETAINFRNWHGNQVCSGPASDAHPKRTHTNDKWPISEARPINKDGEPHNYLIEKQQSSEKCPGCASETQQTRIQQHNPDQEVGQRARVRQDAAPAHSAPQGLQRRTARTRAVRRARIGSGS